MTDPMYILGAQVAHDMGFDTGGFLKGLANVADTGITSYEADEAKKKAAAAASHGAPAPAAAPAATPLVSHASTGNFLTEVHGGLPVWTWGAVGAGALTIIALLLRGGHSRRR